MEKLNEKMSLVENLYSIKETYTPKLGVYDLAKFEGYFEKVDSAITQKHLGNKFEVSLMIREQDVINEYTMFLHGRDIITITEGFKVINEILKSHDVVINYSILSRENHVDPTRCVGSEDGLIDYVEDDYEVWHFVGDRLPKNESFMCIVQMYNEFSDTWTTGAGVFNPQSNEWEATDSCGEQWPVRYWRRCPDFEEIKHHYTAMKAPLKDETKSSETKTKIMKEKMSYRAKLIEVIIESYVEVHTYDFTDKLNEDLQEILDLNLKFETKILDMEIKNKLISIQICFEDENGEPRVLDVTIGSANGANIIKPVS